MSISLPLVRTAVLGATNILALLVLALSAYTLTETSGYIGVYFTYSALGVATSVIHLTSIAAMIIVGRIRDGAFSSKVGFQVGWLSYLCIMWLSTGAQTAATMGGVVTCTGSFCGATQAIAAFGFFNWIILLGYIILLVTAALRVGNNVWMSDAKDLQWIPGTVNFEKNINSPNPNVATYPPGGNPNYGPPPVIPQSQPNYPQYGGSPQV